MAKGDDKSVAPFVKKVVPDPKVPADVHVLSGWAGEASRQGFQRIYLSLALDEYVEVPDAAIRHSEAVGGVSDGLQRTLFWIEKGTKFAHTRTTPIDLQSVFLQGAIARQLASTSPALEVRSATGSQVSPDDITSVPCLITHGGAECRPTGPFDRGCKVTFLPDWMSSFTEFGRLKRTE